MLNLILYVYYSNQWKSGVVKSRQKGSYGMWKAKVELTNHLNDNGWPF